MTDLATYRMVRGGETRPETLLKSALVMYTTAGRPGISVFAADVDDDAELYRRARHSLPHAIVRFGWVRHLMDAGCDVEQTGHPLHFTVWLPDVNANTIAAVSACFEPPVPAPPIAD